MGLNATEPRWNQRNQSGCMVVDPGSISHSARVSSEREPRRINRSIGPRGSVLARLAALALLSAVSAGCGGGSMGAETASTALHAATDPSPETLAPPPPPVDSTFAFLTEPTFGAVVTGTTVTFQWTAASGALGYELQVGSTQGASDVFDSGLVSSQSLVVSGLPSSGPVYARVRAILPDDPVLEPAGHWIHGSDVVFFTAEPATGATFVFPTDGRVSAGQPIIWTRAPGAYAYRLLIGTQPGAADVDDSGPIHGDRRLVPMPPQPTFLIATLETIYSDWIAKAYVRFEAMGGNPTADDRFQLARIVAGEVRELGNVDNQPYAGTLLYAAATGANRAAATCTDYTTALLNALSEANVGLIARRVDVCLNPNSYDCHELTEVFNPETARWSTLDSTFGLETLRSDGVPATTSEISAAVRSFNWNGLKFNFLTASGNSYAKGYYLDYPLLFVDVYSRTGPGFDDAVLEDLAPYYTNVGTTVTNNWGPYALACASGFSSATVNWNGSPASFPCTSGIGITRVFYAVSLSPTIGDQSVLSVLSPNRYIF